MGKQSQLLLRPNEVQLGLQVRSGVGKQYTEEWHVANQTNYVNNIFLFCSWNGSNNTHTIFFKDPFLL